MSCSLADSAHAQSGFRQGYIITTELDTIHGLIDFQEDKGEYQSCTFKRTTDSSKIRYRPTVLVGFGFLDGPLFVSQEIEKEINNGVTYLERVFLEVLVAGELTLMKIGRKYYVSTPEMDVIELASQTKSVYKENHEYEVVDKKYVGVLYSLMSNCPDVAQSVRSISLSETQLVALFEQYHACMQLKYTTYKVKKPALRFNAGIMVGINSSFLNFSYPYQGHEHLTDGFDPSYTWLAGLSFDVILPRISEGFSIQMNGYYEKNNYSDFSELEVGTTIMYNEVQIKLTQLKLPIGFQYIFKKTAISPFINGGFSPTIHLSTDAFLRQEIENNSVVDTYESIPFVLSKNQLGFYLSIGADKPLANGSSIQSSLRFELTNGIIDSNSWINRITPELNSRILNINLMLGYVF